MAMTPDEIKQELRARGITMSAVGRRLRPKVSHVSVWRAVHQIQGQSSKRIESAVANAIDRTVGEVFGDAA